jgi:paraquat-inducible protein A
MVSRVPEPHGHYTCRRCGTALHFRKPNSLSRTWALLIASFILYVPANLLPITHTTSLGHTQSDTIMSGVLYFISHGDWPLALVIFTASVAVPFMKLVILTYLLISVQRGSTHRYRDRTRLYRITELVGRWSMVDVFVVTVLVALVQLGALANINAGWGAVYFGAVVVATMFAAESFDPRLIWEPLDNPHESAS